MKISSASVVAPVASNPPRARRRLSWRAKGRILMVGVFVICIFLLMDSHGQSVEPTLDPAKSENYTERVIIRSGSQVEKDVRAFPFKENDAFKVGLKPKTINVVPGAIIVNAYGGSFVVTAVERHGAHAKIAGDNTPSYTAVERHGTHAKIAGDNASSYIVCTVAMASHR